MKRVLISLVLIMLLFMKMLFAQPTENSIISPEDKSYLLNLARQTVLWHLKSKVKPQPTEKELSNNVRQQLGCFVTLQSNSKGLRGCIGTYERSQPLYKNVISHAIAATHDSRFRSNPVTYKELKDIKIEISVLTEPKDLNFDSPEELLSKLRPLIDGVILYTKHGSSIYLPQLWEHFSKKEDFLSHLCQKHHAPMDVWKTDYKNIGVQIYQAIVFCEDSSDRKVVGPKGAIVGKRGAIVLGAVKPINSDLLYGEGPLEKGTKLAPGAIVTWGSDIYEPN